MNSFCTLFDSNYLTRGLAMYQSLIDCGADFHLYVYSFDDLCHDLLTRMKLPRISVISLAEFESEALLAVKSTRTPGEYCWTCASHTISHSLETFRLNEVTYIDADLIFYHDPELLLCEFHESGGSVLLTEHRYTPEYDLSELCGIFCVQFITFRNDATGLEPLRWWQERCLEWCFNRDEDGKFGDQKYLDDWPQRFKGIHVLQYTGGGVAPWNVQQYQITSSGDDLCVDRLPLVFYHFHGYQRYADNTHELSSYRLAPEVVDLLYRPYVRALERAEQPVREISPGFTATVRPRTEKISSPLRALSVITPVFNGIRFIEFCLRNVIEQNCPGVEHIIVDGGSSDGTVEVIKQYSAKYSHIRWLSEPDRGQSDAMNKGIGMACSTVIGFLNVDDYYEPDALNSVVKQFVDLPEPALLVGNCTVLGDDGTIQWVNKPTNLALTRLLVADEARYPFPVNPSAYFYHKSLHDSIGMYNSEEHYTLDIDFILRAVTTAHCIYVDMPLGNYRFIAGTKTYEDLHGGTGDARFAQLIEHYKEQLPWHKRLLVSYLSLQGKLMNKISG